MLIFPWNRVVKCRIKLVGFQKKRIPIRIHEASTLTEIKISISLRDNYNIIIVLNLNRISESGHGIELILIDFFMDLVKL